VWYVVLCMKGRVLGNTWRLRCGKKHCSVVLLHLPLFSKCVTWYCYAAGGSGALWTPDHMRYCQLNAWDKAMQEFGRQVQVHVVAGAVGDKHRRGSARWGAAVPAARQQQQYWQHGSSSSSNGLKAQQQLQRQLPGIAQYSMVGMHEMIRLTGCCPACACLHPLSVGSCISAACAMKGKLVAGCWCGFWGRLMVIIVRCVFLCAWPGCCCCCCCCLLLPLIIMSDRMFLMTVVLLLLLMMILVMRQFVLRDAPAAAAAAAAAAGVGG